ncbi:uncharacterized protein LOC110281040 [Arachis duranensis]|uniref:Uncharacterized protein LOC110281040 n=1 Tax=Arachis duranensis TaxID=130453 RepID=A0A6P5NQG8_ARADU|nr:uncharacterized protein LOC110281040 [Arachis duranensis]
MRCKDVARLVMDVSVEPVTSLCFKTGNEDMIYASSGTEIKCFDVRLATKEWKSLENYNYNKEEINKVVCNLKSSFLAAADDIGEVKVCFIFIQYVLSDFSYAIPHISVVMSYPFIFGTLIGIIMTFGVWTPEISLISCW